MDMGAVVVLTQQAQIDLNEKLLIDFWNRLNGKKIPLITTGFLQSGFEDLPNNNVEILDILIEDQVNPWEDWMKDMKIFQFEKEECGPFWSKHNMHHEVDLELLDYHSVTLNNTDPSVFLISIQIESSSQDTAATCFSGFT
ncbi:hypothetical protein ACJX0J_023850, partial [Zea mays]